MSKIRIYHNPRCSKSREALTLLKTEQREQDIEVIDYLKTPPDTKELTQIIRQLGISPRQLLRTKESLYHELQLNNDVLTDEELIQIMCEHPKLIERPIVIHNHQAIIGRPPETVLSIL